MEEVHDKTGAILFKSSPEKDPLEKKIVILEGTVQALSDRLSAMENMLRAYLN